MVVSIGSRGSHIPAITPRRKRLGVIAGMWDPLDPIETTMTLIAVNISLLLYDFEFENFEIKQTWNLKLEIIMQSTL